MDVFFYYLSCNIQFCAFINALMQGLKHLISIHYQIKKKKERNACDLEVSNCASWRLMKLMKTTLDQVKTFT